MLGTRIEWVLLAYGIELSRLTTNLLTDQDILSSFFFWKHLKMLPTQDWWTNLRFSNFRRNDGCSEADDWFNWSNPGNIMLENWISLEIWKTETYNSKSRYFDYFSSRPDTKHCLSMITNDLISGPRNVRSNGHQQRWPHKFPWIC